MTVRPTEVEKTARPTPDPAFDIDYCVNWYTILTPKHSAIFEPDVGGCLHIEKIVPQHLLIQVWLSLNCRANCHIIDKQLHSLHWPQLQLASLRCLVERLQ